MSTLVHLRREMARAKAALDETYAVPPEFGSDCERVAQDVGFPYIHLLHTFVRF